jgi:dihydroxyacetone kinase-like predicted kinase
MMFEKDFYLEFILHAHDTSAQTLKNSLREFAENIEVIDFDPGMEDRGKDFKVSMKAQDPTVIFDICAQFGRIRSVKVQEKEAG